jgi:hypothetical protein
MRLCLLHFLRRDPSRIVVVGQVSSWLLGGHSLERTEELLEKLVAEGVLRLATPEELKRVDFKHGYFVTAEGMAILPPEDVSYGVL